VEDIKGKNVLLPKKGIVLHVVFSFYVFSFTSVCVRKRDLVFKGRLEKSEQDQPCFCEAGAVAGPVN
jgi:hypothetical protein